MARFTFSKENSYTRGAARFNDLIYLSMRDRKLDRKAAAHSRLIAFDGGEWAELDDVEWATAGMCVVKKPAEKLVAISPHGNVLTYVGGKLTSEQIMPKPFDLKSCGTIDGAAYACGMKRQVYRRMAEGRWAAMHAFAGSGKSIAGFEAIAGFSAGDIYAVGWDGEIWQWNPNKWVQRSSPVNTILTGVVCAPDKKVYVCGQEGTLLAGRNDTWNAFAQRGTEDDFWDLCWFKDTLYVASLSALYQLKGKDLTPVNFGKDAPKSCYKLTAAEGVLWSVGSSDVFSFDGEKWTRWD